MIVAELQRELSSKAEQVEAYKGKDIAHQKRFEDLEARHAGEIERLLVKLEKASGGASDQQVVSTLI